MAPAQLVVANCQPIFILVVDFLAGVDQRLFGPLLGQAGGGTAVFPFSQVSHIGRGKAAVAARRPHDRNVPIVGPAAQGGGVNIQLLRGLGQGEPGFGGSFNIHNDNYCLENLCKSTHL
jgi:hypothetical protein